MSDSRFQCPGSPRSRRRARSLSDLKSPMTEKSAEFQLGKIAELLKRQDALAARREYLAAAALDSEIQKLKAEGVLSSESQGARFGYVLTRLVLAGGSLTRKRVRDEDGGDGGGGGGGGGGGDGDLPVPPGVSVPA